MTRAATETSMAGNGRVQLTPEHWIRAAADLLVNKSIEAVRVEVLAKDLNVTRGSFYWHFRDREDLLRRVLMAWRDEATEQVIQRFEKRKASARELIGELTQLPFRGGSAQRAASTELAIRAWARRDEMARQVVDQVDGQRLEYMTGAFRALGLGEEEARLRAYSLYSFQLAEALLSRQGTPQEKEARRAFTEAMLLRPQD